MKRFAIGLAVITLSLAFLSSPSISEARGEFGGHGGWGHHFSGFHGGHIGFHRGPIAFPRSHIAVHDRFFVGFGVGFWPDPFFWGPPIVGWPYYATVVAEAPPVYVEPGQPQPYYWYYCQNPQGYYPYVGSCPGGWIQVVPNETPPNQ